MVCHFYLDGEAPKKPDAGDGVFEVDLGVSTMAVFSEKSIGLVELAPKCREYNRKIRHEQLLIDWQMRQANPDNYHPDGRAKKAATLGR